MPEKINPEAKQEAITAVTALYRKFKQEILHNPDLTLQDIDQIRDQFLAEPLLQAGSETRASRNRSMLITLFEEVRNRYKQILRYKDKPDAELFELVFAEKPKSLTEIIRTPIGLYFKIADRREYTDLVKKCLTDQVYRTGRSDRVVSQEEYQMLSRTSAITIDQVPASGSSIFPQGESCIALENSTIAVDSQEAFEHEFFHILYGLLTNMQSKNNNFWHAYKADLFESDLIKAHQGQMDKKELINQAHKYLKHMKLLLEYRSQNEILAHYVSGSTWERITKTVAGTEQTPPHYDYVTEFYNTASYKKLQRYFNTIATGEKLEQYAQKCFSATEMSANNTNRIATFRAFAQQLETEKYSRDEIAVLASFYPMRAWGQLL